MRKRDRSEQSVIDHFGKAVLARRTALGMTQQTLADKVGVLRTTLCNIENGEQGVSLFQALKIAAALEVTLSTLIEV